MTHSSDTGAMTNELVQFILDSLELDQIYDSVLSYIEQRYRTELEDVTDIDLKQHIVEQRLSSSFEECGIMDMVLSIFKEVGITSRLEELENRRTVLQNEVNSVQQRIDSLVSEMTNLQINSFGRVVRLFDDRIIDLAKEDEDVELIERPVSGPTDGSVPQSSKDGWRTLQPSELLLGLTLAASQPVLCRKEKDTWFPGHISAVSYQPNSTKTPESAIYDVTLDAAPGFEPEVCQATTASLAMAVSALELKQKYPVGARVVSIYRDDGGGIGYYSGLIAEPPSERNNHRYLLFFDDGYTQYSPPNEIYRICHQSKENWKEATEGSQGFIKRYLAQYPQVSRN
ncbi:Histone-lysine N-methyltransferase SETDB [Fasciolopsis buskii]|uniref:Histone-lysine N-methyltransferase SETDB n=1 Tax=Fasciolopsis buskii TaxID=27845 RepID=A0A8E0RYL5_9TREM|nr:Histone-lysine N-methyltransferase SETDB [Fasciolopsis buski]